MAAIRYQDLLSGMDALRPSSNRMALEYALRPAVSNLRMQQRERAAELARQQAELDRLAVMARGNKSLGSAIGGTFGNIAGAGLTGLRTWDARDRPTFAESDEDLRDLFADIFGP
tara:strand:+ start:746 stop:1090 length:345 start_codon:yes stop_codon:yes gene_type:complete